VTVIWVKSDKGNRERDTSGRSGGNGGRSEKFVTLAKRYADFTELTPAMLNEFVDKIFAHEAIRINGNRNQKVDICLNFVGKFDVAEASGLPARISEKMVG
jgi:hypothetical protein